MDVRIQLKMVTTSVLFHLICLSCAVTVGLADPCATNAKCDDCMRTAGCSWCMMSGWQKDAPRCVPENSTTCTNLYAVSSKHNNTPSKVSSIMSPERVKLDLRINTKYAINITYTQPKDYPLDLYYLMDLSYSMKDDKVKLSKLCAKLNETISTITADFRLGFGSFIDKMLRPFGDTYKDKNAYGFRHHLSLTNDSKTFAEMVDTAKVYGNVDPIEGGLDGIVQALVCDAKIGWRPSSRRLMIFSTDEGFHTALDGKLGGIIEPNDGQCHLDENGYYTETLNQDYPSVPQISRLAKKHSVNIIFAVTEKNIHVYKRLSERVEGSSCAVLSADSDNVVEIIQHEYNKIRSTVEMKDNRPSFLDVAYYSKCNNDSGPSVKTNKCENLKNGDSVSFQVVITAKECPKDKADWNTTIEIYPVGFQNHSTMVEIKLLCKCDCPDAAETSYSGECNNRGTLKCGVCVCNEESLGRTCECSTKHTNIHQYDKQCQKTESELPCSGRGTCSCGECKCNERDNPMEQFSGLYCECDNFSCARTNGKFCSGNGACICGRCGCNPNFNGTSCDCSMSQDNCLAKDGSICSGHGQCVCNKCVCDAPKPNEGQRTGAQCQRCPTCPGQCDELRECVLCRVYKQGALAQSADRCDSKCTDIEFHTVARLDGSAKDDEKRCVHYWEEDACKFQFSYKTTKSGKAIVVTAQEKMDCQSVRDTLIIVFGVIAVIVLFGLGTLLVWKWLTNVRDGREFQRFVNQSCMEQWYTDENPLFKDPNSLFQNPVFRKSIHFQSKEVK